MREENVMASIEQSARLAAARPEPVQAAERMRWGARWMASFRGESDLEENSSPRPEDVARSEVFYRSTGCWV